MGPKFIEGKLVSDKNAFRVRFRFRVEKKLNLKANNHSFSVGGKDVVLSAQLPDVDICDSDWLVVNARPFGTEEEARGFGHAMKASFELSSVATRLGIDAGIDLPTSAFGKVVQDHVRSHTGIILRSNVHGLDVFSDDPNVRIGVLNMTGTVRASPDLFLSGVDVFHSRAVTAGQTTRDLVLLLNYALMRTDPVAQIVISISAVEMLGQQVSWSTGQKEMLARLATAAIEMELGTVEERNEIVEAIQRNLHRLSLRQGVLRLLDSLALSHLKKNWDTLYSERSSLVHGLAPRPGASYGDLAHRTVSLCGHIILKFISADVPEALRHIERYQAPTSHKS